MSERRTFSLRRAGCAAVGGTALALFVLGVARTLADRELGLVVRGRVLGTAREVVLVEPERGVLVAAALAPDGRFEVAVPPGAGRPWIVVHGEGAALVQTAPFAPGLQTELPPLALWRTEVRVRCEGGRVRCDWAPLPRGEALPESRRYSVLVGYETAQGDRRETSLLAIDPVAELDLAELLELLPDHAERSPLEVTVRAFDPTVPEGTQWVGGRATWSLPR